MVDYSLFGPIDAILAPQIELLLLVVALGNVWTRRLAFRRHRKEATEEDASLSRHPLHQSSNLLLLTLSLYYATVHPHGGVVMSVLVVGVFLTDIFEFESRRVEARNEMAIERPWGSLAGSVLVVAYAFFQSLFFLVKPIWSAIV